MIGCVTIRWVFEGLDSDPILCVVGRYLRPGNNSFQISTSLCSLGGGASLSCFPLFHRCFETSRFNGSLKSCLGLQNRERFVCLSFVFIYFQFLLFAKEHIFYLLQVQFNYMCHICGSCMYMCVIMCVLLVLSPGTCTLFVIKKIPAGNHKRYQKFPNIKHATCTRFIYYTPVICVVLQLTSGRSTEQKVQIV